MDPEARKRRPIVGQFKKDLIERHGTRCKICGSDGPINWHHIIPFSCGGPDTVDNIIPLCEQCHARAHGKALKPQEQRKKLGRHRETCEHQDAIFRQYVNGEITMREACILLGRSTKSHITEMAAFKEWCEETGVARNLFGNWRTDQHGRRKYNFGKGGKKPRDIKRDDILIMAARLNETQLHDALVYARYLLDQEKGKR